MGLESYLVIKKEIALAKQRGLKQGAKVIRLKG